jgi:hypothetical protein
MANKRIMEMFLRLLVKVIEGIAYGWMERCEKDNAPTMKSQLAGVSSLRELYHVMRRRKSSSSITSLVAAMFAVISYVCFVIYFIFYS